MQLLVKETEEKIDLNKDFTIPTEKKRWDEEAKPEDPAVFHQRHYCLTWGEYVNVFFGSTSKNILLFCSV